MAWEYANAAYNGGKVVKISGGDTECIFKAISSYKPQYQPEYEGLFTTYDGKEIRDFKGTRFSLSFTAYGITQEEFDEIKEVIKLEEITLKCDDFDGAVYCSDINANLAVSNYLGTYYTISLELTAAALIQPETDSGSL